MKNRHPLPTVEEFLARVGEPIVEGTQEGVALEQLKQFHEYRGGRTKHELLKAGWSAINFMALAARNAHWGQPPS